MSLIQSNILKISKSTVVFSNFLKKVLFIVRTLKIRDNYCETRSKSFLNQIYLIQKKNIMTS